MSAGRVFLYFFKLSFRCQHIPSACLLLRIHWTTSFSEPYEPPIPTSLCLDKLVDSIVIQWGLTTEEKAFGKV